MARPTASPHARSCGPPGSRSSPSGGPSRSRPAPRPTGPDAIIVRDDLTIPGHPAIFVVGDLASVAWKAGRNVPGVAQGGIQGGPYAARTILARLDGVTLPPFSFRDYGELATIGRLRAVADFRRFRVSGVPAWFMWLAIHIFWLIGFQNRLLVLVRWAWSFVSRGRGNRLITGVGSQRD